MAPRRRPAKKGETRMDAAIDAMTPYGFPRKLVRQTVSQLLQVYGGNDGWVFIEDSAYTLLINTLLEQQQQDHGYLIEDSLGNGPNEASPSGCSTGTLLLPCSNTEASDSAPLLNQAIDTISAASETGNYLPIAVDTTTATSKTVNELPIMPAESDTSTTTNQPSNQLAMEPFDTSAATNQTCNQLPMAVNTAMATSKTVNELHIKPVDTSEASGQPSNHPSIKAVNTVSATNEIDNQAPIKAIMNTVPANNEYETLKTKSSQPMGRLCHKRRRPCHGWISSDDDDEEEDLIVLPALYKLVNNRVN